MGDEELKALREEAEHLRAENEALRARFRVDRPQDPDSKRDRRPIHVLLLPDPLADADSQSLTPAAAANVARSVVSHLRHAHSEIEWRAEHDLSRIPEGASCFQLGEVVHRMWNARAAPPRTFRVERDEQGGCQLRRCLVEGESESDSFSAGYDWQIRLVDDLLREGQAAYSAGAHHHAGWALKAVDVILAYLALALADFQSGGQRWRRVLAKGRPEYEPQYSVPPDARVGA